MSEVKPTGFKPMPEGGEWLQALDKNCKILLKIKFWLSYFLLPCDNVLQMGQNLLFHLSVLTRTFTVINLYSTVYQHQRFKFRKD